MAPCIHPVTSLFLTIPIEELALNTVAMSDTLISKTGDVVGTNTSGDVRLWEAVSEQTDEPERFGLGEFR